MHTATVNLSQPDTKCPFIILKSTSAHQINGTKLTVFLPVLNRQIRSVVATTDLTSDKAQTHYSLVLCYSNTRCSEIEDFARNATLFCKEVIEVVCLNGADIQENKFKLAASLKESESGSRQFQSKNKMIITTPNQANILFKSGIFKNAVNEAIVIDKVDMHIALELGSDLIELGKYLAANKVKPLFKTIITTNVASESEGSGSSNNYVDIKKAFFGENKALVIQINEEIN